MTKTPLQATGHPEDAGKPDGVDDQADATGREPLGGAYASPHTGKKPNGFRGGQMVSADHGGQRATDIDAA